MRAKLIAFISLLLISASAYASEAPNKERGFAPDQVYQLSGIDIVNLFNGHFVVSIPIQEYPVGPNSNYGLRLVYNSSLWEGFPTTGGSTSQPSKQFNVGLGWMV